MKKCLLHDYISLRSTIFCVKFISIRVLVLQINLSTIILVNLKIKMSSKWWQPSFFFERMMTAQLPVPCVIKAQRRLQISSWTLRSKLKEPSHQQPPPIRISQPMNLSEETNPAHQNTLRRLLCLHGGFPFRLKRFPSSPAYGLRLCVSDPHPQTRGAAGLQLNPKPPLQRSSPRVLRDVPMRRGDREGGGGVPRRRPRGLPPLLLPPAPPPRLRPPRKSSSPWPSSSRFTGADLVTPCRWPFRCSCAGCARAQGSGCGGAGWRARYCVFFFFWSASGEVMDMWVLYVFVVALWKVWEGVGNHMKAWLIVATLTRRRLWKRYACQMTAVWFLFFAVLV